MYNSTTKFLLVVALLFYAGVALSQEITVSGTVTDGESGVTIPGVNVLELATKILLMSMELLLI